MNILGISLVIVGLFFFASATVGLLRFPDCYCRMHATGKADTMGVFFTLIGLGLIQFELGGNLLLFGKVLLVIAFWFVGGPTATHALLRSAFQRGLTPWSKHEKVIFDWPGGES